MCTFLTLERPHSTRVRNYVSMRLAADERVNPRSSATKYSLKRLEDIRERPIALRDAATHRRRKALVRATAVVACYRPHRESGDVAV